MKKIITSAFIIAMTIGVANAQAISDSSRNEIRKEHRMEFDHLNLTADQKARLKTLRADFRKQIADLKNNSKLTVDEQQSRRKELHQQFRSQAEAILTPAQKDQLAKMKADWKANHKDGKGRFGNNAQAWHQHKGAGFAIMQKELGLSADQQTKLSQIKSDYKGKFESLRNDQSLSADQRKEKMQELRKEQRVEMKTVLTPDQLKKLQSLRKEHQNRNTK